MPISDGRLERLTEEQLVGDERRRNTANMPGQRTIEFRCHKRLFAPTSSFYWRVSGSCFSSTDVENKGRKKRLHSFKFPTSLTSGLRFVASGLVSTHFTFLASLWWAALICSKWKKMTRVQSWMSSIWRAQPFGSVWSTAKHEMWSDCWFPGPALTGGLHKYWIFGKRRQPCQNKKKDLLPCGPKNFTTNSLSPLRMVTSCLLSMLENS